MSTVERRGRPRGGGLGTLRPWAWVGMGLILGAVAGWAAGNPAAGFGVGVALGVTFAYAKGA